MKVWKIALVSVLALGLVLGVASPALAAPPWAAPSPADPPPPRVIRGEVVSIEGNTTFVVRSGWSEVTVLVNDETDYFKASVPAGALTLAPRLVKPDEPSPEGLGLRQRLHRLVAGVLASVPALVRNRLEMRLEVREGLGMGRLLSPFGEEATFDDIEAGNQVVVWAVADGDNLLAKRVVIMEPTTYHHLVGTISEIDSEAETIAIITDDGESIVLSYDEETCFILRGNISLVGGEPVRAVYDEEGMAKVVVVVTGSG
jgi:hypothetical protein